jgi:hypothetical protein
MPQKSLEERAKRAKRAGVPFAIKQDDAGGNPAKSRHAVKKSRGIAGLEFPPDRRVGMKAAPGRGRNRSLAPAQSAAPRRSPAKRDRSSGAEVEARHVSPVRGRKKPPSEMHIRHPGG